MSKLTSGTATPAYGRDYKNAKDAIADFERGLDFWYCPFNGPKQYHSIRDYAEGAIVKIRYNGLRDAVIYSVSQ